MYHNHTPKRILTGLLAWFALFSVGYTPAPQTTLPAALPVAAPTNAPMTVTPEIATPSPEPTPTASPVPTIDADWYRARNEELRMLLKRNGSFESDEAIEQAISQMWIDRDAPMVALTFDDGPIPGVTDKILDILERYHVRATFFVVGWRFKREGIADIVRRATVLGCEIGNHTWQHDKLTEQEKGQRRCAITATNDIVYETTGYTMRSLRPPGGDTDAYVARTAKAEGMAVVLWSQSGDVYEKDPARIAQNVQKQIVNGKELENGGIILLHDTKPWMVDAVEIIVPRLLEQGYQLTTVWELLNCSEAGFTPGETYRNR